MTANRIKRQIAAFWDSRPLVIRRSMRRTVGLAKDDSGAVLVYVTIVMMVFSGFLGMVIDLGYAGVKHEMAQTAADAAALAAIQQISTGSTEAAATTTANLLATDNGFGSSSLTMGYLDSSGASTVVASSVVTTTATISNTYPTLFLRVVGINTATVGASAYAINTAGTFPCVFCVLSGGASPALDVDNNANVTVTNGAVIVNSNANGGLTVGNNGIVTANLVGVVGNATIGNNGVASPSPTHITAIPDPLAGMTLPTLPSTVGKDASVGNNGTLTIDPGVYTTISSSNNALLTLNPGTYYITSSMTISNNGILSADNVLLYFTCGGPVPAVCLNAGQAGASLDFENNASSTLSGLTSGNYKGMAILYDRNNTSQLTLGNNTGSVSGTIYAKSATLHIQNNASVVSSRIIVGLAVVRNNGSTTVTATQSLNYAPPGSAGLVR